MQLLDHKNHNHKIIRNCDLHLQIELQPHSDFLSSDKSLINIGQCQQMRTEPTPSILILPHILRTRGSGNVVGIATGYGLDGPGIESRWGGAEIFRTCPDRPRGPPSLLYKGYRVFSGGKERPGRDADPSPPSSAVVKERVELHLYLWAIRPVQSLSACTRVHFF